MVVSMVSLNRELSDWLQGQLPDLRDLRLTPLRAEASFRSFYRVGEGSAHRDTGYVLMDSPPEKEQNRQFEALAGIFRDGGVPVPEILASQPSRGWYLLSDLGRRDLEAAYSDVDRDQALAAAIENLVRLQSIEDPAIGPYTAARFSDELAIFSEWLVTAILGMELPDSVAAVFEILVEKTQQQPQCCVHRDYHCRNLLFNEGRLGVVDFQDALIGPVSYDLASLLHDCYYEFPPSDVERWTDYYLSLSPFDHPAQSFSIDIDYMAIQRQIKAAGIFARLKLRDDKSTHLTHIQPVLRRTRDLASRYDELLPLSQWLDTLDLADALAGLDHAVNG